MGQAKGEGGVMVDPFADLPKHHFGAILADPPWRFKSNSTAAPGHNPMRHYQCMSLDWIRSPDVERLVSPNAALFLWVPGPFLVICAHIPIMEAWGFKPSAMAFDWVKLKSRHAGAAFTADDLHTGTGFTTRKNVEYCVLGKRGKSVRRDCGVHEVIIAPRREHSRKPDETHTRIERYCADPYIEFFARQSRPGWTTWGNECVKFDGAA